MSGHAGEPHGAGIAGRLNWLRAGVLGANDAIVSVAAIVVGVAAATTETSAVLAAGAAGLVGGAISMALGEYVSVSSQSDSEKALIAKERAELLDDPDAELAELTAIYRSRGLSEPTAHLVAVELTQADALRAHLDAELGIDPNQLTNPWHAAMSSAAAFTVGGALPLLAILLPPEPIQIPVTFVVVLLALAATGAVGTKIGGSPIGRATIRVIVGGAAALAVSFLLGSLLGTTGVV
jgi:VIT1/CCC1 family predicted Fe2+/Mn2+ transporter